LFTNGVLFMEYETIDKVIQIYEIFAENHKKKKQE
jgi:hypothetical protein